MSMVPCKTCKKPVIETAHKCPHCESLGPKKAKRVRWIVISLFVFLVVGAVGLYFYQYFQPKKSAEELRRDRMDDKIAHRTMTVTLLLRTKLAIPDSLEIKSIKANEDGSILCYQYKSKQADGKIKPAQAVFAEGELRMNAMGWDLYCVGKSVVEVRKVKPSLD